MPKSKIKSGLVDVWGRLHTIFEGNARELPEICFVNMTGDQLAACLIYMMNYSREVNSKFRLAGTNIGVEVASPESAIRAIVSGEVSAAIMMDFPGIPAIVVHIDDPEMLSLSYIRGQWTPTSAIAFFDLLNQLVTIAPNAELEPDTFHFSPEEQATFLEVWQEFHNAAS
jgi:hypothetical protein